MACLGLDLACPLMALCTTRVFGGVSMLALALRERTAPEPTNTRPDYNILPSMPLTKAVSVQVSEGSIPNILASKYVLSPQKASY